MMPAGQTMLLSFWEMWTTVFLFQIKFFKILIILVSPEPPGVTKWLKF